MRAGLLIVGVILLLAGLWVTVGHGSYQQTDTVAQLGPAKLETTHTKAVPPWLGVGGIVIGGLLLLGGIASKKR
jgi:hypothetical protein